MPASRRKAGPGQTSLTMALRFFTPKYEQPHDDLQPSDLCTLISRTSLICLMLLNVPGSAALKRLIFLYLSHSRVTAAVAKRQRQAVMDGREEL